MAEIQNTEALKELLYKMADDQLILGHRYSEWIGLGPQMEEDIAFGSLAQDKVGHAYNLYQLLNNLGERDPDTLGFLRKENEYKCCHLTELPNGGYDVNLVRHFLFDNAEMLRFESLMASSYESLANLAKKFRSEIKYHIFHANTWVKQLGAQGNEESKSRMQSALNALYPVAFSIFEPGPNDDALQSEGIFEGELALQTRWAQTISEIVEAAGLKLPEVADIKVEYGGRFGYHTTAFTQLLSEMCEVINSDPTAEW